MSSYRDWRNSDKLALDAPRPSPHQRGNSRPRNHVTKAFNGKRTLEVHKISMVLLPVPNGRVNWTVRTWRVESRMTKPFL